MMTSLCEKYFYQNNFLPDIFSSIGKKRKYLAWDTTICIQAIQKPLKSTPALFFFLQPVIHPRLPNSCHKKKWCNSRQTSSIGTLWARIFLLLNAQCYNDVLTETSEYSNIPRPTNRQAASRKKIPATHTHSMSICLLSQCLPQRLGGE